MYKSAQSERQTGRGIFNKLREKIEGLDAGSQENAFAPEFDTIMNKLRYDTDDAIRSIITGEQIGDTLTSHDGKSLKDILAEAKSFINRREYMLTVSSLSLFHEKMSEVVKILNSFTYNVDKVHQKFLFDSLDDESKKRFQSLKTRFAESEFNIEKQAGIISYISDFFSTITTERGRALRAWEKSHPKEVGKIKNDTNVLLKSSEQLLSKIMPLLKDMASARATRNPDKYIESSKKLIKFYDSYNAVFKKYYEDNLKKYESVFTHIEETTAPPIAQSGTAIDNTSSQFDSSILTDEEKKKIEGRKKELTDKLKLYLPKDESVFTHIEKTTVPPVVQSGTAIDNTRSQFDSSILTDEEKKKIEDRKKELLDLPKDESDTIVGANEAELKNRLEEFERRRAAEALLGSGNQSAAKPAKSAAKPATEQVAGTVAQQALDPTHDPASQSAEVAPIIESRRGVATAPPIEPGTALPPAEERGATPGTPRVPAATLAAIERERARSQGQGMPRPPVRRTYTHTNFYNSLQKMASESPIILALYISKYAKLIKESDPETAIKLFKIASSIEV
jgi:hypothetical protein